MLEKRVRQGDCDWLLGSLCNLFRIPFDAALVASQFPPPYSLVTFHEVARALGFRTGIQPLTGTDWDRVPFPCIAFLQPTATGIGDAASDGPPGEASAVQQGDATAARADDAATLEIHRLLGNKTGISYVYSNLAALHSEAEKLSDAQQLYEETLAMRRAFGDRWGIASTLSH